MCVKFSVSFKEGNNVELYIYGTVVNNVSLILYISIIIWLFLSSVNFITVMDVKFVTVMLPELLLLLCIHHRQQLSIDYYFYVFFS